MNRIVRSTLSLLGLFLLSTSAVQASSSRATDAHIYNVSPTSFVSTQKNQFTITDAATNGGTVATCNIQGNKQAEIIVGSGPDSAPMIWVYSASGKLLSSFAPYSSDMKSGVTVACGQIAGKHKRPRIVTGTMQGAGPQVQVFRKNGAREASFFAYDSGFHGGVFVATGNIDGKGKAEIITGAGPGGGPQVRVLRMNRSGGVDAVTNFYPFSDDDHGGVTVASANVDGDASDEIIMGLAGFGQSWVKVYKVDSAHTVLGNFKAYDDGFYGGVMVAAADIDRDGQAEVLTVPRRAGGPNVRAFSSGGTALSTNFMAYESDFSGGVALSATTALDKDKALEIITVPQKNTLQGDAKKYKYIDVNLSDQTLRAYKAGRVDLEFLISSGVAAHPSPIGDFAILQKIPVMDYTWNYGPGNPDNYDLKNVPWNLHFYADYFVHNAYWHNNFGNPMSHGCINASLENSKAIYDWANVGDPISVHY